VTLRALHGRRGRRRQEGVPAIDFLAPDIHFQNYAEWVRRYRRSGNPVFVPEAVRSTDASVNGLYAFGGHDAIGFSPFGIESIGEPAARHLAASFDLVAQLEPLLLSLQGKGRTPALRRPATAAAAARGTWRVRPEDDVRTPGRPYPVIMKPHPSTPIPSPASTACGHGVCPWYLGYLLASPIRRLVENPERLLAPLVRPGMTVLEPGSGMGFFSLPLARLVGPAGRVVCVDLQPKMLEGLRKRARRAGVDDRIHAVVCGTSDLGIEAWTGQVDLAVAIHMVHEIPDAAAFFRQVHAALRTGGRLLVIEPKGHVTPGQFETSLAVARAAGFAEEPAPGASRGLTMLLTKPGA
jgi:SAM-dependent methyltransferase